ncbi:MAG: YceI family protein [Saprospiraceae bacterium]|nr:YceI family protein [Saprospiraceae bacterium]
MKKNLILAGLLSFGLITAFKNPDPVAEAPTWNIDKNHSSVSFSVRHFFANVMGSFDDFEGDIKFHPDDLENSNVNFSVSVTSVNTKNDRRDNHLQSEDFFHADKWPKMTFESTNISKAGDHYVVRGNMTIRDVTREVELPVKFLGEMEHPRREGTFIGGFSTEFTIDRNEFGVGSGDYVSTATIGGEIDVTINLEVNRTTS